MADYYYVKDRDTIRGYDCSTMEIWIVDGPDCGSDQCNAAYEAEQMGAKLVWIDSRGESCLPSARRVVFMVAGTNRVLAVLRPDGNNWWDPNATIEEKNAMLPWIGKIREYVDARNSLADIVIHVEVEYDRTRARFRSVAAACQEVDGHGGPVQARAEAEREGAQDC